MPLALRTNRSVHAFSRRLLSAASALSLVLPASAWAQSAQSGAASASHSFAIPAQPLETALRDYMQQSGVQVGYESADVAGRTSAAVNGAFGAGEALSRLLGGTGLTYRFTAPTAVRLERAPTADAGTVQLGAVRVAGAGDGASSPPQAQIGNLAAPYAGGQVASGGQLGLLGNRGVMDTPFNQTNFTAQRAQDQQAKTIKDVLIDDPSVRFTSIDGGPGIEGGTIRGFSSNSSEFSYGGLFGMLPTFSPMAELAERIEVLKGPNVLLNGMPPGGSLGGTVNIVPKRAPDEGIRRATISYVSSEQLAGHIDVGQRFGSGNAFGLRFNGAYRDGEGPVRDNSDRRGLAVIGADFRGENVRLSADIGYQYQKIDGVIPYIALNNGIPLPDAPSRRINQGQPWGFNEYKDKFGVVRAEVDLSDRVTAYASFGAHDSLFSSLYSSIITVTGPGGAATANAPGDIEQYRYNRTGEMGLRGQLTTGPIDHQFAVSGMAYRSEFGQAFVTSGRAFASNIYAPTIIARPTIVVSNTPRSSISTRSSLGVADTLSVKDGRIQLTLGGRLQQVGSKSYSTITGAQTSRYSEDSFSPAIALLVKPWSNVSVYGNYIEGLQQGSIVGSTFANAGEIFPPYRSKQYEVGVKIDFGRFGATASAFQVARPSLLTIVATNTRVLDGEQRNRGLEFNVFGEPVSGVRLLGGVMLLDAELTKTQNGATDGWRAPTAPKVNFNLSAEWDVPFVPGLTIDGRVVYTGSQYIDTLLPRRSLPDWTRVDLGLRQAIKNPLIADKALTLRLDVENVAGSRYWAGGDSGTLVLGAPRTVRFSISTDF